MLFGYRNDKSFEKGSFFTLDAVNNVFTILLGYTIRRLFLLRCDVMLAVTHQICMWVGRLVG